MRLFRLRGRLIAAAFAASASLPCAAADPAPEEARPSWRFNGYGTFGVAHVDVTQPGWNFTRDLSQPAQAGALKTTVDSRLGLQLNWQAAPQVELVTQAVLRHQDPDADELQRLDWAFVAWRPDADWTVRAGRTSPDVFLFADYRNVGFAFPWVRPSVEMYGYIAFQALDGVDVARRWRSGDAEWKAKAGLGRTTTVLAGNGTTASGERAPGTRFTTKNFLVATLSREEGGLTWKATYAQARAHVDSQQALASLRGGLQQLAAAGVPGVSDEAAALAGAMDMSNFRNRYLALALEYEQDRWHLTAELSRNSGDLHDANGLRGYISAAYRIGSLTPYVVVGRTKPERGPDAAPLHWAAALEPIVGADAAASAVELGSAAASVLNRVRYDQRSVSVGMRWDISTQAAVKLQADRFHVAPGGAAGWPGSNGFDGGRATVVSATVDFVF